MKEKRVPVKVVDVLATKGEGETELYFVLFEDETKRQTCIYVGQCEAWEISRGLREEVFERPLTYETMLTCLALAGAVIEEGYINKVDGELFHALVNLRVGDKVRFVDMRPSDAVSLAIRVKCPLYMNEAIVGAAQK